MYGDALCLVFFLPIRKMTVSVLFADAPASIGIPLLYDATLIGREGALSPRRRGVRAHTAILSGHRLHNGTHASPSSFLGQ